MSLFCDTSDGLEDALRSGYKWFPHDKGGAFRKWFGNKELVISFDQPNFDIMSQMGNHLPSRKLYFKEGMTWTSLTSGSFNGRYTNNSVFDAKGPVLFSDGPDIKELIGFFNSNVAAEFLKVLAPTMDFNQGPV